MIFKNMFNLRGYSMYDILKNEVSIGDDISIDKWKSPLLNNIRDRLLETYLTYKYKIDIFQKSSIVKENSIILYFGKESVRIDDEVLTDGDMYFSSKDSELVYFSKEGIVIVFSKKD